MKRIKVPKLIFFDMEGTIFRKAVDGTQGIAPSAWTLIAKHLGLEALAEEEATKARWNQGGYRGYSEWVEDSIRIHQKYGLDRKFFEKVIEEIDYHPGVEEVFEVLNRRGVRTALVSGGFKAQANRAAVDLRINHVLAACEYFWDPRGRLIHWNVLPADFTSKLDFMKLLMKEYKLRKRECAFVGDGRNDIPLAKVVGRSISFNGDPELQNAATYSVNQAAGEEDFRVILPYFGIGS